MNPISQHPRVGVLVIVEHEDKVLLGKRKGSIAAGTWGPPGGHLEFGESVEACAKRELLEETSMQAHGLICSTWVENIIDERHYITLIALVKTYHGTPQLLEPEKCEGWHWFSWSELPTPLISSFGSFAQKRNIRQ